MQNVHNYQRFGSQVSPVDASVQDKISDGFGSVREFGLVVLRSILFFGVGCAAVLRQGTFTEFLPAFDLLSCFS